MPDSRARGAYYTVPAVTNYLTSWAIRKNTDIIMEPSFGSGAFIGPVLQRLKEIGGTEDNLFAVEMHEDTFNNFISNYNARSENFFNADFLSVQNFPVDVIIGNPPYIRLRHLDPAASFLAKTRTEELGVRMSSDGSIWMPFVVHACSFLKPEGRLALVLPYEITHVKYAIPLWEFLGRSFSLLSVIRTYEDPFPENEEEIVLLLADGYGGTTENVQYKVFNFQADLQPGQPVRSAQITLESILNGSRPFTRALLDPNLQQMLNNFAADGITAPLKDTCKFKIGYVAGDKHFFHPGEEIKNRYNLSPANFINTVKSSRQLGAQGLFLDTPIPRSSLYYPLNIDEGDLNYIKDGEKAGVHNRYKCRNRNPWYLTPDVEKPDLILTVFSETPTLAVNSARLAASNSLLCGFLTSPGVTPEDFACRWYNSLVLLSIELNIHSLGGGVLVLIPGEVGKIQLPSKLPGDNKHALIDNLDQCLKNKEVDSAYSIGDKFYLQGCLGLKPDQIEQIRSGIDTLRHWRKNKSRGKKD